MTTPEANIPRMSDKQVVGLFAEVNERFGLQGPPDIKSNGPTSFAAVNNPTDEKATRLVAKMEYTPDPEAGLRLMQRDLDVYAQLRNNGAQLPEIHPDAFVMPMPGGAKGGLVTTMSEYLPLDNVGAYEHGRALASVHNASQYVDLSGVPRSHPLERWHVDDAIKFLRSASRPFTLGNTVLTDEHLATMEHKYQESNTIRDELWQRGLEHGSKTCIVQEDVHNENIRGKYIGGKVVGMAIDMFPLAHDLAATDFGRPLNDWVQHFGGDPADVAAFKQGYQSKIEGGALPHPEELELAADYTQIRSSLVFIGIAVHNHLAGLPKNKWLWDQGLHRVEQIDNRQADWRPLDARQKTASDDA